MKKWWRSRRFSQERAAATPGTAARQPRSDIISVDPIYIIWPRDSGAEAFHLAKRFDSLVCWFQLVSQLVLPSPGLPSIRLCEAFFHRRAVASSRDSIIESSRDNFSVTDSQDALISHALYSTRPTQSLHTRPSARPACVCVCARSRALSRRCRGGAIRLSSIMAAPVS